MNGIDKITARVIAEAEAEAEALQSEAKQKADYIMSYADARAAELTESIVERGRGEAGRLSSLAVSSAETLRLRSSPLPSFHLTIGPASSRGKKAR